MTRERSVGILLLLAVACGAKDDARRAEPPTASLKQAVTGTISASPNPCLSAPGQQCATTISWTRDTPSLTYQVWVRTDNLWDSYFACTPPDSSDLSDPADWLLPGHTYRFSLRSTSQPCSIPDPAGTELAAVVVNTKSATIDATSADATLTPRPVLVPAGGLGSTTVSWNAPYGTGFNNIVWVNEYDGSNDSPYGNFACSPTPFPAGSSPATWIQAGHTYRFSLRPTPTSAGVCSNSPSGFPEVASVSVKGYTHYLIATPNPCSAGSSGSCATTLHWGSSSNAAKKRVMRSLNGGAWTQVACATGNSGTVSSTLQPGTNDTNQYTFALWPVATCAATTTAVATTEARALSQIVVHDGAALKLGGTNFKAMGINKYDLFAQYWLHRWPPPPATETSPVSCSEPAVETCTPPPANPVSNQCEAEGDLQTSADYGMQYLRIAGVPYRPNEFELWQNCPAQHWQKFDAMLAAAQSRNLKLIVTLLHCQFTFSDMMGESLAEMIQNPQSVSRQKLFQYAGDLVARYKDNTTIQAWELVNELDVLADVKLAGVPAQLCTSVSQTPFSSDEMANFMRDFALHVRSLDKKHVITSGYTTGRLAAAHLRAKPNFNDQGDWTADDPQMFASHIGLIHPDPIDITSIHFYNGDLDGDDPGVLRDNERFEFSGRYNADALGYFKRASDAINKPLFIGEYNDSFHDPDAAPRSFARGLIKQIVDLHVPLSAPWTWLWHHPVQEFDDIEPPTDADYISYIQTTRNLFNATTKGIDATPQNYGFEAGTEPNGDPLTWTRAGSGSVAINVPATTFNQKVLKLTPTAGSQLSMQSSLVAFGVAATGSPKLFATVALRTSSATANARLCVVRYTTHDGSGTATTTCTAYTAQPNEFKVVPLSVNVPTATRSVRIKLVANASGSVEFDDARVSLIY